MPTTTGRYPEGTYGAFMEQRARDFCQKVQIIQERVAEYKKNPKYTDADIDDMLEEDHNRAAEAMAELYVLNERIEKGEIDPNGKTPESGRHHWSRGLWTDYKDAKSAENLKLYRSTYINQAAAYFGVNDRTPPTPEELLRKFRSLEAARENARRAAAPMMEEKREQKKQRIMDANGPLLEQLKNSTQRSFFGKLKSFFVGNSNEYNDAFAAVKGLSEGSVDPKKAKTAIKKYLDLRGNKVRDHAYGRDRFDAMMTSLASIMEPQEFVNYCAELDNARDLRSKGTYKKNGGKIKAEQYLSGKAKEKIAQAQEKKAQRENAQKETERIEDDARLEPNRDYYDFFGRLKGAKNQDKAEREWLNGYALKHPAVRDCAREMAEKKGLKLDIPETPENLAPDVMKKLRERQKIAQDMARVAAPDLMKPKARSMEAGL